MRAAPLAFLVTLLAVTAGQAAQPSAEGVPERLIVGFHNMPEPLIAGDLLHGAPVLKTNAPLRFAVVHAPPGWAEFASGDPNVRLIREDRAAHTLHTDPKDPLFRDQYAPQLVRAPEAWDAGFGTHAKNVCTVDTGLRTTHEDLALNFVGGIDFIDGDGIPQDRAGHGTHVAGIAAAGVHNGHGIAGMGNVGLLMAGVYDGSRAFDSDIASAIQWCADNGGDVISMSFGAPTGDPFTEDAVRYAHAAGALLVASAGNGGCNDCIATPARLPEVMAVACVDQEAEVCSFSSRGPEAELAAPGLNVLSTCSDADDAYCRFSGTSMSAPAVAGIAALTWTHRPDLEACHIRSILREAAADLGDAGWDDAYGHGLIDARAALDAALAYADDPTPCALPERRIRWIEPLMGADLRGPMELRMQALHPSANATHLSVTLDGAPLLDLEPVGDGVFRAPLDARDLGVGPTIVHLEATATFDDGTTAVHSSNHTIDNRLRARFVDPPGPVVSGTVEITVHADAVLAPVAAVRFCERDHPCQDITGTFDGTTYRTNWNSTHVDESTEDFTYLDIEVEDTLGNLARRFMAVTVDNLPGPSIRILHPTSPGAVVGATRILYEAHSTAGRPLTVWAQVGTSEAVDITQNRMPGFNDVYYHDWEAAGAPLQTLISGLALDAGGRAHADQLVWSVGLPAG